MNWQKNVNDIKTTETSDLVKKVTITPKCMKLKRKYLTIINIVLLRNLIRGRLNNFAARAKLATKDDIANFVKTYIYIYTYYIYYIIYILYIYIYLY